MNALTRLSTRTVPAILPAAANSRRVVKASTPLQQKVEKAVQRKRKSTAEPSLQRKHKWSKVTPRASLGAKPSSHAVKKKQPKARKFPKSNHYILTKNPKEAPYIEWIAKGVKGAEGRVFSKKFQKMKVGETVCFHNFKSYVFCDITYLNKYSSFEEMVKSEGAINLIPALKELPEKERDAAAVQTYQNFPYSDRVNTMGAIAVGLMPKNFKLEERV